jgi:transcriptional regulator with PAS, ATPase and Fis domain
MMRNDTLRAWGSRYVRLVLERSGRNKRKACRALGISYHTLQAYLRYAQGPQVSSAQETSPEYSAER